MAPRPARALPGDWVVACETENERGGKVPVNGLTFLGKGAGPVCRSLTPETYVRFVVGRHEAEPEKEWPWGWVRACAVALGAWEGGRLRNGDWAGGRVLLGLVWVRGDCGCSA